jgi:hypothetical protein
MHTDSLHRLTELVNTAIAEEYALFGVDPPAPLTPGAVRALVACIRQAEAPKLLPGPVEIACPPSVGVLAVGVDVEASAPARADSSPQPAQPDTNGAKPKRQYSAERRAAMAAGRKRAWDRRKAEEAEAAVSANGFPPA